MKLKITKKRIIGCLVLIFLLSASTFHILNMNLNPKEESIEENIQRNIHSSGSISHTKQWIANPSFTSTDNWTSAKGTLGDPNDVDANIDISVQHANFTVIGDRGTKQVILNETTYTNWEAFNKTDNPLVPNNGYEVDSDGVNCSHLWDDHDADQTPIIYWRTNVSMGVDMSDYIITSASLEAVMNASVHNDIDVESDTESVPNKNYDLDQRASYDYAQFFVEVADMEVTELNTYELAFNQTETLGEEGPPTNYDIEGLIETKNEQAIIDSITNVLAVDPGHDNFTLILGIYIYCADNYNAYDEDSWLALQIKDVNLTFTYQRKIDQLTSISWNQVGDKPEDISSNTVTVNEALLYFNYMIDSIWPSSSPNSEIRILINDIQHSETIKLSTTTTDFQPAKDVGFDVTNLIKEDENINLSIQVYIADEFTLNQSKIISIDNVYLNVTYTETFVDIGSNLYLFLDTVNKTDDPVIELPLGENLNITVKYTDNQTDNHLTNATVQLEGKVIGTLNESLTLQQYSIIVNTSDLGIGVNILTVTAEKLNYKSQSIQIYVDVTERETELELYLDGIQKLDGGIAQLEINEILNVTVIYKDFITTNPLLNATVELVGVGELNETNGQYNITINANDLGVGITSFTISAQLINYESQSIQFFVEIVERATELELYLDGIQKLDGEIAQLEINEILNVTVIYKDFITTNPLLNATVELVGVGELNETNGQYNITINANDLGVGITSFTISAQLINYESQSIQFFVEIVERATELSLFINGNITNAGDTIKVELDKTINITAYFRDNLTNFHLPNATITLLGWDNLNETNEQYTIVIDSNDLDQGITILTVFAQLVNYQSQSINFFIEVIEKSTILELFLNGDDKTLDPVFNLTIGGTLNITVKYTNQTGAYIPDAIVQLVGEGLSINLTWDDDLKQHYTELNTLNLDIGFNLYSIIARATNYEIQTINPIITVNRIRTAINISSLITAEPGDDVLLRVILNDLDFGGTVTNATVTYVWAYGQGELVESEIEGIYEVILENVPVGTYTITINALTPLNYDYGSKEITLDVSSPTVSPEPDLSWLIYVLIGGIVGLVSIFTLHQIRFKHPPMVRKIRKLRKKIRKGRKLKPILLSKREEIIGTQIKDQVNIIKFEPELMDLKSSEIKKKKR